MKKLPKRRTKKDNPYTLLIENNNYFVIFKDNKYILHKVEISEEIFNAFNSFELQDIRELNEYDRHIEHSVIFENNINARAKDKPTSFEDEVINKTLIDEIKSEINNLPAIQRERIKKYFFENKTYEQIARNEGVNKTSVMRAINNGLEKISKKIKN